MKIYLTNVSGDNLPELSNMQEETSDVQTLHFVECEGLEDLRELLGILTETIPYSPKWSGSYFIQSNDRGTLTVVIHDYYVE